MSKINKFLIDEVLSKEEQEELIELIKLKSVTVKKIEDINEMVLEQLRERVVGKVSGITSHYPTENYDNVKSGLEFRFVNDKNEPQEVEYKLSNFVERIDNVKSKIKTFFS